jgi:hypothetical protein
MRVWGFWLLLVKTEHLGISWGWGGRDGKVRRGEVLGSRACVPRRDVTAWRHVGRPVTG